MFAAGLVGRKGGYDRCGGFAIYRGKRRPAVNFVWFDSIDVSAMRSERMGGVGGTHRLTEWLLAMEVQKFEKQNPPGKAENRRSHNNF